MYQSLNIKLRKKTRFCLFKSHCQVLLQSQPLIWCSTVSVPKAPTASFAGKLPSMSDTTNKWLSYLLWCHIFAFIIHYIFGGVNFFLTWRQIFQTVNSIMVDWVLQFQNEWCSPLLGQYCCFPSMQGKADRKLPLLWIIITCSTEYTAMLAKKLGLRSYFSC